MRDFDRRLLRAAGRMPCLVGLHDYRLTDRTISSGDTGGCSTSMPVYLLGRLLKWILGADELARIGVIAIFEIAVVGRGFGLGELEDAVAQWRQREAGSVSSASPVSAKA